MTFNHTNLKHRTGGNTARYFPVYILALVLATACLRPNPDYVEDSGIKKANGEACSAADECDSGYCDTVCCPEGGTCCADSSGCNGDTPVCSADHRCVECQAHAHCQQAEDGGVSSMNSPLGLCSPDNLCTCWSESEKGTCIASEQCPDGQNYVCASDVPDNDHFACLRRCTDDTVVRGLICENRVTAEGGAVRVWAPVTSCYAFNIFDSSCTKDDNCSVYEDPPYVDGVCPNGSCTYPCTNAATGHPDDDWCPESYACGDDDPALCGPP